MKPVFYMFIGGLIGGLVVWGVMSIDARRLISDDMVSEVSDSIRKYINEHGNGAIVDDVVMIREGDHELTGFVTQRIKGLAGPVDRGCQATLDDREYIWICGQAPDRWSANGVFASRGAVAEWMSKARDVSARLRAFAVDEPLALRYGALSKARSEGR